MKGKSKKGNRKNRVLKYSILGFLFTCLFVVGYYLTSTGIIFGKFTVKDNTYQMGEVSEISPDKITVTSQTQEGAVPLTSDNEELPAIPSFEGKKGSETNPFVLLEVVPQLSQQSLTYLVDSQESGLPFDPVEVGIKFCDDFSFGSYLQWDKKTLISWDTVNNQLQNSGYTYFTNRFPNIGIADGSNLHYYDVDFLYKMSLYSGDISEDDFNSKTVKELVYNNAEAFAASCPDLFSVTRDDEGNVVSLTAKDDSLLKALEDERNWAKIKEENADVRNSYSLRIPLGSLSEEDFNTLTMAELKAKYPDLFVKDSNNKTISEEAIAKNKRWVKEKTSITTTFDHGYLVKVGKGKGEYTLSGELQTWNTAGLKLTKTGTDTDMWNYVESDEYPSEALNIEKLYSNSYEMSQSFTQEGNEGCFLKMFTTGDIYTWNHNYHTATLSEDVFLFSYAKYVYSFKYAGIRINNFIKYSLFERETQEQYDELHVKVIAVTPDMINEMDANDTENTVDYIERADCIYVSQYYNGYNLTALNASCFLNFYNTYCGGTDPIISGNESTGMITFNDNDLEWFDCMKIMKRLSTNRNFPLMWTKLVGGMAVEGVDGSDNSVMYIDENNTGVEVAGALNNLSKLYYITLQFDLLDYKNEEENKLSYGTPGYRRTFMDDIFPYIKVMKLNEDQQGTKSEHPAQYTGYWERNPLALSGHSDDYKQRCYYLWNKFTFLPTDITGIYGSNGPYTVLSDKYGYLPSYFYQNAFQNATTEHRGAGSSHGTDGYDDKNVTVAGTESSDDENESIPLSNSVLNRMLEILKRIMDNVDRSPDNLIFTLHKYPKYYTKMTNDTILLDYSMDAKYRDPDKYVIVKFDLKNTNNEDSIIRKISLVPDEDSSGDDLDLWLSDSSSSKISKEDVAYSSGQEPINGYKVAQNNSITCYVPVRISDWQNGNKVLKVEWTARMKYQRSETSQPRFYGKNGTSYVYVGERELFSLE